MYTPLYICKCFFFFFFKQKTAYEMRISDWSSDVCSSDLARSHGRFFPSPRILAVPRCRARALRAQKLFGFRMGARRIDVCERARPTRSLCAAAAEGGRDARTGRDASRADRGAGDRLGPGRTTPALVDRPARQGGGFAPHAAALRSCAKEI